MTPAAVVVCGPSGAGKSTVAAALAARLGFSFVEADALHPPANVAKMRAGEPLDDADRAPWLARVGDAIRTGSATGVVVACSALTRRYRRAIESAPVFFVLLDADEALLDRRVGGRPGHFMPASLVRSQLETLEPLCQDEPGITLDASRPVPENVERARTALAAYLLPPR